MNELRVFERISDAVGWTPLVRLNRSVAGLDCEVFAKIDVNGSNADPLFQHLKKEAPGALGTEAIKWNFTKFLVDQNGRVVARFEPSVDPLDERVTSEIEALLEGVEG